MLRVMMLITDLQRGGTPLRMVRLARQLREMDVDPVVGCLAPMGPLKGELGQWGIENYACGARGPRDIAALGRLSGFIEEFKPDVIHATLFHGNLAARICNRGRRPLITSSVTIEIERRWHNWLESLTLGMSDVHVANSQAVADHVLGKLGTDPRRLRVIPNGLDLREIDARPAISREAHKLPREVPLIVWAGRLDPIKNLSTFVAVVERLRWERDVRAVILGDGPRRGELERLIARRGLRECIRMEGWSNDVIGWLKAADLLLFPSLTEGSSNVLLEAMACRCALIASNIDACRELARDGRGLDCGPRDVDGFVHAIHETLDDLVGRTARVGAARAYVEAHHGLLAVGAKWRELYHDILRKK